MRYARNDSFNQDAVVANIKSDELISVSRDLHKFLKTINE